MSTGKARILLLCGKCGKLTLGSSMACHTSLLVAVANGRPVRVEVEHVGKTYLVHNGKEMIRGKVTSGLVDHTFGEFVRTRQPPPRKAPPKGRK